MFLLWLNCSILIAEVSDFYWVTVGMGIPEQILNRFSGGGIAGRITAHTAAQFAPASQQYFCSNCRTFNDLAKYILATCQRLPVFAHFQMLQESQFANVQISEFFLMQLLMNAHALLLWLAGLVFLLFTKSGKKYRAIGFCIVALFAILIAIKGKAYYTLGIYPALFAAGGAAVEQFATQKWRWVNPLLLGLMLLSALPLVPFGLPVLGQNAMIKHAKWSQFMGTAEALRWEDGKMHDLPQDYADMIGWREIGNLGIAAWQKLTPAERDSAIIYTENYGQAGAIWYYGRPENLPQPISFSDNYLFWVPEKIQFNTFIYVNDELGEDIQQMFGNIELAGSLDKPLARENGVQVYICRDPKPEFLEYAAGIAKRIKQSLHH
ncbi:MAG: hypothetical protein R3C26_19865 [Calditrichia bacterium]